MPPYRNHDHFDQYEPPQHGPDHLQWRPIYTEPIIPRQRFGQPQPRPSPVPTVVALLLFVLAVVLVAAFFPHVCAFLGMIGRLADNPTEREATLGMFAFGLSIVAILAALRIVLQRSSMR